MEELEHQTVCEVCPPPKLTYNIVPFLASSGCPRLPDVRTLAAGALQLGPHVESYYRGIIPSDDSSVGSGQT